jgi:hypothetical protein
MEANAGKNFSSYGYIKAMRFYAILSSNLRQACRTPPTGQEHTLTEPRLIGNPGFVERAAASLSEGE